MSNCLVVQHVAPESAYAIADALVAGGVDLDTRRVYTGDVVPADTSHLDGLVVMGGPMSATSDTAFATRRGEINLLADAVRAGIPTLGVCLGAQLLAAAAGGAVMAGDAGPEIGWGPVELLPECHGDALFAGVPTDLRVLHWHGDTFELPTGARRLATNGTYPNQAFRIGDVAWGLQFHLEIDEEAVEAFLDAFAFEVDQLPGGASAIRGATAGALDALAAHRDLILARFATLVSGQVTRREPADLD